MRCGMHARVVVSARGRRAQVRPFVFRLLCAGLLYSALARLALAVHRLLPAAAWLAFAADDDDGTSEDDKSGGAGDDGGGGAGTRTARKLAAVLAHAPWLAVDAACATCLVFTSLRVTRRSFGGHVSDRPVSDDPDDVCAYELLDVLLRYCDPKPKRGDGGGGGGVAAASACCCASGRGRGVDLEAGGGGSASANNHGLAPHRRAEEQARRALKKTPGHRVVLSQCRRLGAVRPERARALDDYLLTRHRVLCCSRVRSARSTARARAPRRARRAQRPAPRSL